MESINENISQMTDTLKTVSIRIGSLNIEDKTSGKTLIQSSQSCLD